jgi:Protein of unknown function (DUF2934)
MGGTPCKTYSQKLAREIEVNDMSETFDHRPLEKELPHSALLCEAIEVRAYQLYAPRGYLDGFHLQDWLQAEQEILGQLDHQAEKARAVAG